MSSETTITPATSNVTRVAVWRRILLFVLDTRPPWWGRSGVWLAAAMALLLVVIGTQGERQSGGWSVSCGRISGGPWLLNDVPFGAVDEVAFPVVVIHQRGPGWERWDLAEPHAHVVKGCAGSSVLTHDEERSLFVQAFDEREKGNNRAGLTTPDQAIIMRLVHSGQTTEIHGLFYWVRAAARLVGFALLVLALLMWEARRLLRLGYKARLAALKNSCCPKCGYSLIGLDAQERCPECGLLFASEWRDLGRQQL
jgi:hypothetical protein